MTYLGTLAGSGTANLLTVTVLFFLNCIRKRLNKSKCQSHCYLFDCEAQLDDLKHVSREVKTQRGLIENVLDILDGKSSNTSRGKAVPDIENP